MTNITRLKKVKTAASPPKKKSHRAEQEGNFMQLILHVLKIQNVLEITIYLDHNFSINLEGNFGIFGKIC